MWAAAVAGNVAALEARHGRPVRYNYVPDPWPLSAYQTVFARSPGSAEMPSAARPFTAELVTELISAGVLLATVTLHAGVASLETGEAPLPEWFSVPPRHRGPGEPDPGGRAPGGGGRHDQHPGAGKRRAPRRPGAGQQRAGPSWSSAPARPARVVTGLITGWHDEGAPTWTCSPRWPGPSLVRAAYQAAEQAGYLWHEFGDSCLLLPPGQGTRRAGTARAAA